MARIDAKLTVSPDSQAETVSSWKELQNVENPNDTVRTETERLNINDHLNLFLTLKDRYKLEQSKWAPIEIMIGKMINRHKDKRLFLGIIGEFGSGKSTLINAFLREELLKVDILPATTCAITVLQYAPAVDAELHLQNNKVVPCRKKHTILWEKLFGSKIGNKSGKQLLKTKKFIHQYSAEENKAKKISRVVIHHPNDKLRSGLVIVDTPGINVENPRHATVTKEAVREVCDAMVVIIPAIAACSQPLIDFLREHLRENIHRCLFIVTKIDLIQPKERERLMGFIASRLKTQLEGNITTIHSVASCYAFEGKETNVQDVPVETAAKYRREFLMMEETVFASLRSSRDSIIAEQLKIIMLSILTQLQVAIENRKREYRERHLALEQNTLPEFIKFIEGQKQSYKKKHSRLYKKYSVKLSDYLDHVEKDIVRRVKQSVMEIDSKKKLASSLTKTYQWHFEKGINSLRNYYSEQHEEIVSEIEQDQKQFEKEFINQYRSLATLGGRIKVPDNIEAVLFQVRLTGINEPNQAADIVAEAVGESNSAKNVGTGVGVVIGTILLPGLGTIVGGSIGRWVGSLFGPSLEELKNDAIDKIEDGVTRWSEKCRENLKSSIRQHIKNCISTMDSNMDRYTKVYESKVGEMIKKDEKAKAELEKYSVAADTDLADLKERIDNLKQLFPSSRIIGN